jgi:serine/threonine protein kinase
MTAWKDLTNIEPKVIYEIGPRKVTKNKDRVIKTGLLYEREASNLRFVAENTTIPVPRVYSVTKNSLGVTVSIEMDYMPGRGLDKAWPDMTEAQRLSVVEELRGYVLQLRNLKGEATAGDLSHKVPCETHDHYNRVARSHLPRAPPESLHCHASFTSRDDNELVFAHGDLAPRNILVDEECRITAILDWEYAGWYPSREHVQAYRSSGFVHSWASSFSNQLPPEFSDQCPALPSLLQGLR